MVGGRGRVLLNFMFHRISKMHPQTSLTRMVHGSVRDDMGNVSESLRACLPSTSHRHNVHMVLPRCQNSTSRAGAYAGHGGDGSLSAWPMAPPPTSRGSGGGGGGSSGDRHVSPMLRPCQPPGQGFLGSHGHVVSRIGTEKKLAPRVFRCCC